MSDHHRPPGDPAHRGAMVVRETAQSLLAAFDLLPDVYVFVKDVDRVFIACSLPFLSLLGLSTREQLYGKRDEDLSPPHLVEHYRRHDEHVMRTGQPLVDLVELVRNVGGSYDWFLSSKTPLRTSAGEIVGMVGITRALSKRDPVVEQLLSLTPAIELISRDYARPLKVEELAEVVPLSTSHFTRVFRRHFGVSPYQYLRRVRVLAASDLLATTELPVTAIAARCGFYDASHFANDFRADLGMSPTAYRRRHWRGNVHRSGSPALPQPAGVLGAEIEFGSDDGG